MKEPLRAAEEVTRHLFQLAPAGILGHLVIMLLVTWLFYHHLPLAMLLAWSAAMLFIVAYRSAVVFRYRRRSRVSDEAPAPEEWVSRYRLGVAATGIGWGVFPLLNQYSASLTHSLMLITILLGLLAAGVVTLGASFSTFLVYVLPITSCSPAPCTMWARSVCRITYCSSPAG